MWNLKISSSINVLIYYVILCGDIMMMSLPMELATNRVFFRLNNKSIVVKKTGWSALRIKNG